MCTAYCCLCTSASTYGYITGHPACDHSLICLLQVHAFFHSVNGMVGVGVLGLPNTMVYLTWKAGVAVQVCVFGFTFFTLWLLCHLHEYQGKRFNKYHELAQFAFGRRLGLFLSIPTQVLPLP